ncbi:MAG: S41 family peptidase [Bacteroidales bacterium]|nr:S41 family peptidase [Bacteroidales bacterium]
MNHRILKRISCWIFLLLALVPSATAQNDFEIAKNVDIFITILKELNAKYADEIVPGDLTKTAIDAMLEKLDPYTVYYPESQIEEYKLMTMGQYGGIGALIQQHGSDVVVSEPYEGCPAQTAGLRAGDKILKVNGQSTQGKSSSDVSDILKGQPGTKITLEVERVGEKKPVVINVTRKEIKLPNLPYYGLVGDNVGYIKLDQFTENAGNEVKDAFLKLKEQGMKYLILDLRNNGGGLLNEAVNIVNIFVDPNITIAETKGKVKEQQFSHKTRYPAVDKNIPIVVLVNEMSASASEIVTGSIQDLDRGVVVGKKTFGKGLVQNVIPLSYNSSLKITVSKYYIPSGRCVQNIDYFNKDTLKAMKRTIPDSLATAYKTKHGRTVYDKGGVEPDVLTKDTLSSNILLSLVLNNLIFDFANEYRAKHDSIVKPEDFVVDDALYTEFCNYIKDKDYKYTTETEEFMKDLKGAAEDENLWKAIEKSFAEMEKAVVQDKEKDLETYRDEIAKYIANEIVVRYYYQKGRIRHSLQFDPEIKVAKEVLLDSDRYKKILTPQK